MRTVALRDGTPVPLLGQGTWGMGERKSARTGEVAALRLGIELRMTLIDTAFTEKFPRAGRKRHSAKHGE